MSLNLAIVVQAHFGQLGRMEDIEEASEFPRLGSHGHTIQYHGSVAPRPGCHSCRNTNTLGVDARTTARDLQLSSATTPTCDQLETLAITSRSHSNIAKWGAELISFRRQVDTSPTTVEGTR